MHYYSAQKEIPDPSFASHCNLWTIIHKHIILIHTESLAKSWGANISKFAIHSYLKISHFIAPRLQKLHGVSDSVHLHGVCTAMFVALNVYKVLVNFSRNKKTIRKRRKQLLLSRCQLELRNVYRLPAVRLNSFHETVARKHVNKQNGVRCSDCSNVCNNSSVYLG